MHIEVRSQAFEPWQELAQFEARLHPGEHGACVCMTGRMRNHNDGQAVQRLTLEHYPAMTEIELQRIATEAQQKWQLCELLIVHRCGELAIGQTIVLVAAWSAHRAAAFAACRHLIEELKSHAPFWKKEEHPSGESRWVQHNTPAT